MTQIIRAAAALRTRLGAVYTDANELPHTAPNHPHPPINNSGFLNGMADVFAVMVHETDGSVARYRAATWVADYQNANGTGGGPQLVVWPDGTVVSLVELPYSTTHGNYQNARAIGVESGHGNDGRYGDVESAPDARPGHPARNGWAELSRATEDVAGSTSVRFYRLHTTDNSLALGPEVVVAPWATANYATPAREQPGVLHAGMYNTLIRTIAADPKHKGSVPPVPTLMVWPEAQYRSWALLARYLSEALLIPRNFPVLPHARRDHMTADQFKRIVLADQQFNQIVAGLNGTYHGKALAFLPAHFTDPAQVAALRAQFGTPYRPGSAGPPVVPPVSGTGAEVDPGAATGLGYTNCAMNLAWFRLFDFYRGFHGHGFSGNSVVGQDDHDCPGPMFDWHRFAREVWDWWWYPFDFDATHATTAVPEREYRRATGATPLVEYFHYEPSANPYTARAATPGGIHGAHASPSTFRLEPDSRVYALANGEVVAAQFPAVPANRVSLAFVLVRHDVWHRPDPQIAPRAAGAPDAAHGGVPDAGRLDYDGEPSTVYSLHMHLGRPNGMSFTQVSDANPDWLNRVLIRKAECDLALPPALHGALAPTLAAIQAADFTQPPGAGRRPTLPEAWRMDQERYGSFLGALAAGDVALAPVQHAADAYGPTPMRVILGDLLGMGGVIRAPGGTPTFGVRVEVFSRTLIDGTDFTAVVNQTDWTPPAGVARPAIRYASEWSRAPTAAQAAALAALGVDPAPGATWWEQVVVAQLWDVRVPEAARLPLFGNVYHYDPIAFMQWLNARTWASEWPKYRIPGALQPPRSRRV